ncbi:hypothetical protein [Methylobacterium sp. WL120]|uniref:hypothetical protein n=1 Tax=Methylobacterium sp. WL120 TaxID=2603887 RepID=UPI0011CB8777|nr:hypothetical protein [Methylobacterium sp. WL120]TXM69673.1 hypothetical protein FV229_04830 [Methylobacterium sp. WL120]
MRYQLHVTAINDMGGIVCESSVPNLSLEEASIHVEEFIDRMERRSVPFVRVVQDLAVIREERPRGLYLGLFAPSEMGLFGSA